MRLSSILLAASLGLALAHDEHGRHIPKIIGGRKFLSELAARAKAVPPSGSPARSFMPVDERDKVEKRQVGGVDGQCGPGVGSCATGYCCSPEGWCGKGTDYCSSPDCQLDYGTGCDGNQKPKGVDTSGVARPKLGSVAYGGAGIYDCVNPGDIAVTFDDGPYLYTNDLLDKLKSYGAKASFMITGNNLGKGMINDPTTIYPAIIKRMHAEGHQICSHTWSHQNASQLTNTQFTNQMVWNEIALNSILGFFPTYMRPPFSICEKNCQSILSKLGYHVIYFDLDTEGYLNDSPELIQNSKDIWDQAVDNSNPATDSFLQIEHDIHYQTVYNLTDYVLTSLFELGYKSVTVGECLGDPSTNWYRTGPAGSVSSASSSSSATKSATHTSTKTTKSTAPTKTGISTDGSCGSGITCAGSRYGSCCSNYGFCGSDDDYCSLDNGCQPSWGSCSSTESTSTSSETSSPSTAPPPPPSTSSTPPPTSTSSSAAPPPTQTPGLASSSDGRCGPDVQETCTGSRFGSCCSPAGKCSNNIISCLAILGCQEGYGSCT